MQKQIQALTKINDALAELDPEEAQQVIRWAAEAYKTTLNVSSSGSRISSQEPVDDTSDASFEDDEFEDVGDLFDRSNPSTDAERALVVGYWIQVIEGEEHLEAFRINEELKNLGHGIGNVTRAMGNLLSASPSLARQISKSGASKQARKKYKLTKAGIEQVQSMIA